MCGTFRSTAVVFSGLWFFSVNADVFSGFLPFAGQKPMISSVFLGILATVGQQPEFLAFDAMLGPKPEVCPTKWPFSAKELISHTKLGPGGWSYLSRFLIFCFTRFKMSSFSFFPFGRQLDLAPDRK